MTFRITLLIPAICVLMVSGCNRRTDIATVPIGAVVQVTRSDGAVVDGTLSERSDTEVRIKSARRTAVVAREDIADVQVVTPEDPAELPPVAKFREYILPAGTGLRLTLETGVNSETSSVGDRVDASLFEAERIDDVEVLPAGSAVRGTVTNATSAGKVKGRASLALRFNTVVARDESYPIAAGISVEAPSKKGKDAATIALPAIGGAIIGAIAGGGKGAAAGAAIGGGAGTAIVLSTEGKPVAFGSGTTMRVTLTKDVLVRVPVR